MYANRSIQEEPWMMDVRAETGDWRSEGLPEQALGRVMVADDDGAMRDLLADVLRRHGYQVVLARSGCELLALLEDEMTDAEMPAADTVIISDIRMPKLDGLTVLGRLRSLGWQIPIIMITAFGDAETHERARSLGATATIDKPFDCADLLATVRDQLAVDRCAT